jgi:hypothetical protein
MLVGPRIAVWASHLFPEYSCGSSPDYSRTEQRGSVNRCQRAHQRRTLQQKTIDFGLLTEERLARSVVAELSHERS